MMEHDIPIIILSDDDDDDEGDFFTTHNDSSVMIVENEGNEADVSKHIEELDEDLAITYSQTATVLPHARYDCTLAFCRAEQDLSGPLEDNGKHCDQCFCYICDKLASVCEFWTIPGICHCNAHKYSVYWKALRDKSLMGFLHELNFTFDPLDMDSDLRHAETSLQKFAGSLAMKYATFLLGFEDPSYSTSCRCICHRNINSTTPCQTIGCNGCYKHHIKILDYDYTVVSQHIKMFLNEAKKENPKACVVMLLGAIKLFVTHTTPGNIHAANIVSETVSMLLWRFMTKVWMLLVAFNFSSSFIKQLESFYQTLPLPSNCTLPKSLSVLPWDDPLLSAVMKGQNITGERQGKGRRHKVLCEPLVVIQARVCKLQQQNKYRELARYLKVVKSINNPTLQRMKDLVPLYLCKDGDYTGAVCHMLSPMPGAMCLASRLTPQQFRAYLRILTSGHAPDVAQEFDTGNGNMIIPDPLLSTKWTPIEGSNSFKMMEVLKFALRVLDCNSIVFANSETWVYLLSVVSSSFTSPDGFPIGAFYPEPDITYQTETRDAASAILEELTTTSRIQIPKTFESGYPDQARLLLATQALVLRIFHSKFRPILSVIMSFRFNFWALRWFFYSLLVRPEVLHYLLCCLLEELSDKRYQLLQRKWTETEHSLVAYFLCMYFWENSVVLDLNTYPTNSLLATWNESHNPWQLSLKLYLECNEAKLTPEKRKILHLIQQQEKMGLTSIPF
uniref:Zgc:112980 n=1 Tax=Cyprinus carpio TaxID=7962 RepID=A0A8C2HAU3_CYPCA